MASPFLVERSAWPFLICGPMLRRVTPENVAVFVAASEPFTAKLRVRQAGSTGAWSESASQAPVQLGGSLHVLVLTLIPASALSVDQVHEYDVQFTVDAGVAVRADDGTALPATVRTFGLAQLGLLTGAARVGLSEGSLPSFAMQSSRERLRLVHASCRKPHGGGSDAMPFIEDLFGTGAADRPHYLILTGDQIYADDVSTSLLWVLQQTGRELMGGVTETLMLPARSAWPGGPVSLPGSEQRAGEERQILMGAHKEVTSGHKDSHLVFLAEFYSMYVLVWSPALWAPGWSLTWRGSSALPSPESLARDEYDQLAEDLAWPKEEVSRHRAVREFARGTAKVRRVLANVSTLMMFDDHEVSDDWNLDRPWNVDSRDGNHPLVHRIVRNALLAFAAFQAWGNDPARFAAGTTGRALLTAADVSTSAATNVIDTPGCVDAPLGLQPVNAATTPTAQDPMLWHWAIDVPAWDYRILALDTRTRREFSAAAETGLISASAMAEQLPDPPSGDLKVTFVLSPAPVLGHPLMEEVLQPLVKTSGLGREVDAEAWSLNRGCLTDLLHRLSRYGRVVLLSGDVHYAYSNVTDFRARGEGGTSVIRSARIVQLCASSLHNEESLTRAIEAAGLVGMGTRTWRGRLFPNWDAHRQSTVSVEDRLNAGFPISGGSAGPVKVDRRVIDRVMHAFASGLTLTDLVITGIRHDRAAMALVEQSGQALLASAYFLAQKAAVPRVPVGGPSSEAFALTLPVGPWFSDELRTAVAATLPAPTPSDTGWSWTWTTSFLVGPIASPPSSGVAEQYVRGLAAQTSAVVGRPNFGEVTLYPQGGGRDSLRHRIHWIDERRTRVHTTHVVPDLTPASPSSPWPAVY